jgi:hypothetical protein
MKVILKNDIYHYGKMILQKDDIIYDAWVIKLRNAIFLLYSETIKDNEVDCYAAQLSLEDVTILEDNA